jgi:hypothetical protein
MQSNLRAQAEIQAQRKKVRQHATGCARQCAVALQTAALYVEKTC